MYLMAPQLGNLIPMVFHHALDHVLGGRAKLTLLRLLLRVRGEHTGRDLARTVGFDHKTCHAALRALAAQGVVRFRRAGTGLLYGLNLDHPVVQDILIPAFAAEAGLVERFADEARRLAVEPVESVILFGSVARRQERATSDVDLLFVTADRRGRGRLVRRLDSATATLASRWGNVPQILVEDRATLRGKIGRGDPFHLEILRTGRVIHGKPFAEMMRHVA